MNILIVGAGPAGLYAGYRLKQVFPSSNISVVERNAADVTFGFGVVFSREALKLLAADDPDFFATVTTGLEMWEDIELRVSNQKIRIDGIGFAAIGRLRLLKLLQECAAAVGVYPQYGKALEHKSETENFDLVIAADGANSVVRTFYERDFKTSIDTLNNRFAWFGAGRPFDALTQTFKKTDLGSFNAHHYRYAPAMSTFLVETDAATFEQCGLAAYTEEQSARFCEEIFKDDLEGASLISNRSVWRRFPMIRNEKWFHEKVVLVGDALRTAHFSIGSGTRLALEDVQALVAALKKNPGDLPKALQNYQDSRSPAVDKLLAAAYSSAKWYEEFSEKLGMPARDFAMSYISRSGRIDQNKLRQMSPAFMQDEDKTA